MNPTRPTVLFAALALGAFALALVAQPAKTVAQETQFVPDSPTPTASASPGSTSPSAATTAIATTPIPTRRPLPTPWKYGGTPYGAPSPAASPHAKGKAKTPKKSAHPPPRATFKAKPRATPKPTPAPTVEPTATPTPEPTASPTPLARGRRADRPAATPQATPQPATPTVAPVLPVDAGVTPIPTQPPTPRPLAANQPSIPDSLADPNVRGIISRPIRELSQVGWMQGTWSVTGVTNKEDGTTLPLDPTTYVFSPIMKNRWMFGADGRATDYIYLTFDPFARHWVALRFGGNPSYGMWVSERGWVGNRIDFITNFSYVNGRQYRRRLTIIHKDARTFGIYETEQTPDGSFIPDDAYEFKKV